jgi:hypothetical protein
MSGDDFDVVRGVAGGPPQREQTSKRSARQPGRSTRATASEEPTSNSRDSGSRQPCDMIARSTFTALAAQDRVPTPLRVSDTRPPTRAGGS